MNIIKLYVSGLILYLATIVGYVPIHKFRILIYKILGMKIGNHTSVHWRARFFGIRNIEIGHNSIIGNDAFLDGRSGLKIGNNVALAAGVWIYTLQHDKNDSLFRSIGKKVCIEDYCWIGARVTILPGVTVGKGAVIATGAVVTKNVKPYEIIGGVPGEKIGIRSENLKYNLDFHYPFQ